MPEFKVVSELRPNMKYLNLKFKVVSVGDPKEVVSRKDGSSHRVAEAIIGDETGTVTMTLWDEAIDKVEAGKSYQVTNAFMSLFKGHMRLNLGRHSELSEIDEEINVNPEKDMSAREFRQSRGRFGNRARSKSFRRRFNERE